MADINGVELSYATKDEYDFEGGEYDDGEVQTAMQEDYEHPFVDEEKERRAGFFDDEPNGNVQITVKQRLETIQKILDVMQNLNGKKGKSKYGFVNTNGRRQLKRIGQFLNEIGEDV